MLFLIIVNVLFYMTSKSECANILAVLPVPSISHQNVFRPFINELVKRGHQVTVITPNPQFPKENGLQNLTEIDIHNISYTMWDTVMKIDKGKVSEGQSNVYPILQFLSTLFEEQIKTKEVQELIYDKKKKFDLIFVESCMKPAIAFSSIYKAPVISISSFGPFLNSFEYIGAATNPLVYPIFLRQRLHNLSLWEKITEMYIHYKIVNFYASLESSDNKMIQKVFGRYKNIPNMKELQKNVQMTFLNVHPLWDSNRPVPPNVIYLGGLHLKPLQPLPDELQSFLDSSKQGVIYMSFGTNVNPSLLPQERIEIFTKVFSRLPYKVLWKWDKNEIPGCPKNVRVSKWFPQSDLLRHKNIKLFITQGGQQSTDEALAAGVPLIGVPMYADQWYNVEMYRLLNIGVRLDLETMTEEKLRDAIHSVITNPNYRQNAVKFQNIIQDQPQTPLDRAVWWTEHVLRHGNAEHLQTPAAHMHWTEYYALDLVLFVFSLSFFTLISLAYSIRLIASYLYYKITKHVQIRFKTKIN